LPLLFQLGFGMTPFQSGMLTFAGAVGAITMKTTAAPILRRFGFRRVLLFNVFISCAFIAASAFFRPSTPQFLIMAVLLAGGFFRSLQFTSINALAYADIEQEAMSRATSFASVAQQLSMSAGVAMGALVLELERYWQGTTQVSVNDFALAFITVAAIASTSSMIFARLPKSAGASLSGRATSVAAANAPPAQAPS
jgi:MFS family permease